MQKAKILAELCGMASQEMKAIDAALEREISRARRTMLIESRSIELRLYHAALDAFHRETGHHQWRDVI